MSKDNCRKNLENFWYYYKWHVIVGIIAVTVAATSIYNAVTKIETDFTIDCIIDSGIDYAATGAMAAELEKSGVISDNNGDGNIKANVLHYQNGRDTSNLSTDGSMSEAVQLRMGIGDAAIMVTEPYILDLYEKFDIFHDLTAIADEMNIPEENRYMSSDKSKVIAIDMKNSEFLKSLDLSPTDCYLAVRVLYRDWEDDEEKINQFENAQLVAKYMLMSR